MQIPLICKRHFEFREQSSEIPPAVGHSNYLVLEHTITAQLHNAARPITLCVLHPVVETIHLGLHNSWHLLAASPNLVNGTNSDRIPTASETSCVSCKINASVTIERSVRRRPSLSAHFRAGYLHHFALFEKIRPFPLGWRQPQCRSDKSH